MLTLAINTAGTFESVVLLKKRKILAEKNWHGERDETEKLLPFIDGLLKKAGVSFHALNRIIVVAGPGPFSAVRIGVTVANMLSFLLKIPLFMLNTKTFWCLRVPQKNAVLLLNAGGRFVVRRGGGFSEKILPLEKALEINKKRTVLYGDLTDEQMKIFEKTKNASWKFVPEVKLKSFAEVMSTLQFPAVEKRKIITPLYWKPPHITYSKTAHAK